MIIPLGLGQKLYKTPVMTLTLVLITLVSYGLQSDFTMLYARIAELRGQLQLKGKAVAYFTAYCGRTVSPRQLCSEFAPLVARLYPEQALQPLAPDETPAARERRQRAADAADAHQERLLRQLLEAKQGQTHYEVARVVQRFYRLRHTPPPPAMMTVPGAQAYGSALQAFQAAVAHDQQRYGLLSRRTLSLAPLLGAQFTHGSLLHVMSNMLMLLIFGVYAEQRLSSLRFGLVYLCGGGLALVLQLLAFRDPTLMLLGASAGVSVVMGLFYCLYFDGSLRLHVPLLTRGRRIYTPIKWSLPLLYVVSDLSAAVDQSNLLQAGGNVAHLAHLYGFGTGMIAGLWLRWAQPLPWSFLYSQEVSGVRALRSPQLLASARRLLAEDLLQHNYGNLQVRWEAIAGMVASAGAATAHMPEAERSLASEEAFTREELEFMAEHLPMLCAQAVQLRFYEPLGRFMASLPLSLPLGAVLAHLGQKRTLQLADLALVQEHPLLALRLYDSFLMNYPRSAQASAVRASALSLLNHLAGPASEALSLAHYAAVSGVSALGPDIYERLASRKVLSAAPLASSPLAARQGA